MALKRNNIESDYNLSEPAYSYGYNLRLKYSSFLVDTLSWFSKNYIQLNLPENLKILSLGCGSGIFDTELIKIIQQHQKSWIFTGIDFNTTDLSVFRTKLLTQNQDIQKHVTLEYSKFTPSTKRNEKYDLITMIHFLHSFDDVLPIIQNAIRHLSPNGKLVIVQQRRQGVAELKESFQNILPNQKFQSSDKIKALLQSDKISFTSELLNTSFDVSLLKKMSLDSLILMSFCLCNDLSSLNKQQQEKIRRAFLSLARMEGNNEQFIHEEMEIIICQRN